MLLLCSGIVLAGTTGTTTVSADVSNAAPTIEAVASVAAQDPTEDSTTAVSVTFTVKYTNGRDDIDVSSASVRYSKG